MRPGEEVQCNIVHVVEPVVFNRIVGSSSDGEHLAGGCQAIPKLVAVCEIIVGPGVNVEVR